MCSPREHRVAALLDPALLGQLAEQQQRLVGDPVLGEVEVEAGALGDQALAALGVGGEEVAQVLPLDLGVVPLERLPGGPPPETGPSLILPLSGALHMALSRKRRTGSSCRCPGLRLDRLQQLVPGLGEGVLALLLQPRGQRVDVDPRLAELRQHLLAVAAVRGDSSPTSP